MAPPVRARPARRTSRRRPSGRVLIVTTATLSLLLIGAAGASSMTPGPLGADPEAVASTTPGCAGPTSAAALEQPAAADGHAARRRRAGPSRRSGAVGPAPARCRARLPSGDVVEVEIVRPRRGRPGVTVVSLPALTHGYELADDEPGARRTPCSSTATRPADRDDGRRWPRLDVAEGDAGPRRRRRPRSGCAPRSADGIAVRTVSTMPGDAGHDRADDGPAVADRRPRPPPTVTPTTTPTDRRPPAPTDHARRRRRRRRRRPRRRRPRRRAGADDGRPATPAVRSAAPAPPPPRHG